MTRTYRPILALHGLDALGLALHRLSIEGRWDDMPALVSDDVVRLFAVGATYSELAGAISARYGGLADTIEVNFPATAPAGLRRELIADIHRIPHNFTGFAAIR